MGEKDNSRHDKLTKEERLDMALSIAMRLDRSGARMTLTEMRRRVKSESSSIRDHLQKNGLGHILDSTGGW